MIMVQSYYKIIISISAMVVFSCAPSTQQDIGNTDPMTLKENVRLAINPAFQDWVLFENGTYIIFDNADTIPDLEMEAVHLMEEYGPYTTGGPSGDFGVSALNLTKGWLVSGHCYGMYTYVHPDEIDSKDPSEVDIGVFGRHKRQLDGNKPVVIHVNRRE